MKCLMACSFYGVILVNEDNEIEWEFTFDDIKDVPDKICGIDYNYEQDTILIAYRNYFVEVDWNKNIIFKHQFKEYSGIHSCFYSWYTGRNFIISCATQNKIAVISRSHRENTYLGSFVGDPHLNFAKQYANEVYFTCLSHPLNKDKKGMLGVFDWRKGNNQWNEIPVDDFQLDGPHCVEPLDNNSYLFTSTGNSVIGKISDSKLVWSYTPEDLPDPSFYVPSERPKIKYSKGAHQVEYLGNNKIMIPLPNHRLVRIINWDKEILNEFKIPESIHKNEDIGNGIRCVYAKILEN